MSSEKTKSNSFFKTSERQRRVRNQLIVISLSAAVIIVFPLIAEESTLRIVIELSILALFATAYNLTLGQAGLFSFGHGGLFGFAVYALALLMMKGDIPFVVALIGAPVLTGIVTMGIGWFCLRLTVSRVG